MNILLQQLVISLSLTALTTALLGISVYFLKSRTSLGRTFFLYCLSIAWWSFWAIWQVASTDKDLALILARIEKVGAFFIPTLFVHFVVQLLGLKVKKWVLPLLYTMSFSLAVLCATPYIVADTIPKFYVKNAAVPGPVYPFAILFFLACVIYGHYELYKYYRSSSGTKRNQLAYLFWSSLFGYIGGCGNFLYVFNINIPILNPFGTYAVPLYVAATTYAIVKYHLMDINIAIKKGAVYGLALALSLVPLFLLVTFFQKVFSLQVANVLTLLLFAIVVVIFYRLKPATEKVVEEKLYRGKYGYYVTLREFSKDMVKVLGLNILTEKIVRTLALSMGIEKAALFLLGEREDYYLKASFGYEGGMPPVTDIHPENPLPAMLTQRRGILVREEMMREEGSEDLVAQMGRIEAELCIPFIMTERLIGFCTLGRKKNREMYSHIDLELLSTMAQQASIALENARLHEYEVKSQRLLRRADRLESLETLVAGISHEMRNPLTPIKAYFEMCGDLKNEEVFRSEFINTCSQEVHRIERLLNELIDFSTPKPSEFTEGDLNNLIEKILVLIGPKTKTSLAVESHLDPSLPTILMDSDKILQAILNILLNAVEATPEGGKVWVATRKLHFEEKKECVQVEVGDTGCGIPPAYLDRIFDPFFTSKREGAERNGTGLGLSITHQIVREHRGTIEVKSMVGKGTTFYVSLPFNPLLHERRGDMQRSRPSD